LIQQYNDDLPRSNLGHTGKTFYRSFPNKLIESTLNRLEVAANHESAQDWTNAAVLVLMLDKGSEANSAPFVPAQPRRIQKMLNGIQKSFAAGIVYTCTDLRMWSASRSESGAERFQRYHSGLKKGLRGQERNVVSPHPGGARINLTSLCIPGEVNARIALLWSCNSAR